MGSNVADINDTDFESEVLKSSIPVLVDFWAPWCGPCKSIAPVLDQLAEEYKGKIKFVKLNVEDNPRTPTKYSVRSIPNLIVFKGGADVDRVIGAVPKDQIIEILNKLV
jgi:thioredoxin 1